ncbi:TetR/AcrR family transcriptional regulator C-terminal domain-containing protein [Carboxylicivirga marina]|uniref:Transcription regulator YsiA C-terminal domain-containing protein n=1 Tax=Carboxylicivirga marina TaxID=2800988 RepID=A0ABS1HDN5_9BACT|nr:TetR/AcrR family transcriptional regulator C-terminal domain-containing protein [Carboxylicivirga marina]MBK3515781.1 hypothetical protein [Carboxylicivirga marina]
MKNFEILRQFTIASALLLICSLSGVQAQSKGKHQGPPPIPDAEQIEKMVSKLDEALSLSDEQSSKIEAIYTHHFKIVEDKRSVGRPSREEMQQLRVELDKDIKNILSAEQLPAYDKLIEEQKQQRGKGKGNKPQRYNS